MNGKRPTPAPPPAPSEAAEAERQAADRSLSQYAREIREYYADLPGLEFVLGALPEGQQPDRRQEPGDDP